ncbi:MAG: hypothetical protein OXR84_05955 [Magnetovibrio sp.]|nr:hypothetical protein [Magnetovibrio sp.]
MRRTAIFSLLLGMQLALAATSARAECEPFPQIKLWGDYTHERVRNYIETRLDGDWDRYITHLDKRQKAMADLRDQGKPLVLKYKGQRFQVSGPKLGRYINASARRLAVVKCLAAEDSGAAFQSFATAAGGNTPAIETASVRVGGLNLDIEGSCKDGDVTFKVNNLGKRWPKSGTIGIYRLGSGAPQKISARHMRLAAGQLATFKVKASKNPTGRLGLWIEPSWAKRPFAFDAEVACR